MVGQTTHISRFLFHRGGALTEGEESKMTEESEERGGVSIDEIFIGEEKGKGAEEGKKGESGDVGGEGDEGEGNEGDDEAEGGGRVGDRDEDGDGDEG